MTPRIQRSCRASSLICAVLTVGALGCGRSDDAGFHDAGFGGVVRHVGPLTGASLVTLDPRGYLGSLCISGRGCLNNGQPREYDLPAGSYELYDPYSGEAGSGGSGMGGFTVSADGQISLNDPARRHFDTPAATCPAGSPPPCRAMTLPARTTSLNYVSAGYGGALSIYAAGNLATTGTAQVIPGRRYSLYAPYSWDISGSGTLFSPSFDLEVGDDGTITPIGDSVGKSFTFAGSTLAARISSISLDRAGYPGPLTVYAVDVGAGPWTLLRNRRYRLLSSYAYDPVRGDSFFSDAPDLQVDEAGQATPVGESVTRSFTIAGTTIQARTGTISVDPAGYTGPLAVWAVNGNATPTSTLLLNRRYRLLSSYAYDPVRGDSFFSAAPDLEMNASGQVAPVGESVTRSFAIEGTTVRARTQAINVDPAGYTGPLAVWAVNGNATPTSTLLLNRRYRLLSSYAYDPERGDSFFSAAPDLEVNASGQVAPVGEVVTRSFNIAGTTVQARTTTINVDPAGYTGPLAVWAINGNATPTSTLLLNRRYRLLSSYAYDPLRGDSFFSPAPDLEVNAGGQVAPIGEVVTRSFNIAGTTVQARTTTINVDPAGYTGPLAVWAINGNATPTSRLLLNRRYRLLSSYAFDPVRGDSFFSSAPDLEVDPAGQVAPIGDSVTKSFAIEGTTVRARTQSITVDRAGYLGPLAVWAINGNASPTSMLLLNRRYRLMASYTADPVRGDTFFSGAPDLQVSETGTVSPVGDSVQQSFAMAGTTITARVGSVTIGRGGYDGGISLYGVVSGPPAPSPLTATVLLGRRYRVTPGDGTFDAAAAGSCTPSALPYGSFSFPVSCSGAPVADCTGRTGGTPCDDGNVCTAGDACDGAGRCLGPAAGDGLLCAGDRCNGSTCQAGACLPAAPPSCADTDPCTSDACAPSGPSLCVHTPAPAGTSCSDGNECNGLETCGAMGCMAGTPIPGCNQPGSVRVTVDATNLGATMATVTDSSALFFTFSTSASQPVYLQPGVTYEFQSSSIATTFRVGLTGVLELNESHFVRGAGTDILVIRHPLRPQPLIEWAMEDRLGKNDEIRVMRNPVDPGQINPQSWNVILDACRTPSLASPVVRWRWDISGQGDPFTAEFTDGCRKTVAFPALGPYQVRLTVTSELGDTGSAQQAITLKDLLIVAMGDSYASGEGSPDRPLEDLIFNDRPRSEMWEHESRHLSRWSSQVQAALMLERSDPHTSVSFISVAQSGATSTDLISDQTGPQGYTTETHLAQIAQVKQALGCGDTPDCPNGRQIDFLLLSIGGNDIGFSSIIAGCAAPFDVVIADIFDDCAETRMDIPGGTVKIPYGIDNGWTGNEFTRRFEGNIRDVLPQVYRTVNEQVRARLPLRQGSKVVIPHYPDPTTDISGTCSQMVFKNAVCGADVLMSIGFTGDARSSDGCPNGEIKYEEARWAHDRIVLPMNAVISNAATELNQLPDGNGGVEWVVVTGTQDAFAGHAYCSADNFIVTYEESWRTEDSKFGTMHPNRGGQEAIARHLAVALGAGAPAIITPPDIWRGSEEDPPPRCADQNVVVGAACRGAYCDVVTIMCKPTGENINLGEAYWHERRISEESNGTFQHCPPEQSCQTYDGVSCGQGVMTGLECTGDYCDFVRPECRPIERGILQNCRWSEAVSDEDRWNVFPPGKIANAVRCAGQYCDSMQYFMCDLVGQRIIPTPPL